VIGNVDEFAPVRHRADEIFRILEHELNEYPSAVITKLVALDNVLLATGGYSGLIGRTMIGEVSHIDDENITVPAPDRMPEIEKQSVDDKRRRWAADAGCVGILARELVIDCLRRERFLVERKLCEKAFIESTRVVDEFVAIRDPLAL
jgi:hypothetical protein